MSDSKIAGQWGVVEPELLVERLPGLAYVYDLRERHEVSVNRPMAAFLGPSTQDVSLVDRWLEARTHPDDVPRVATHHDRMAGVADDQAVEIDRRVRAIDGSWRWLRSWESVLTRDPAGRPRLLLGIAHDDTERMRAQDDRLEDQRRLADSEQRWRSIAENPFDFVVVIDRAYTYTFVNFTAPELSQDELIGKSTPFDFVAPSDHEAMRAALDQVFADGSAASYESYIPSLDKWYTSLAGPIRQGDVVTHVSILTREITAEKQAQARARRAEHELHLMELKLAQSAKLEAVGQLAGGIAHDFNNLLTGVSGIAELLLARLGQDHPCAEYLKDLRQSVKRGAGLTRQLLAFSRQQPLTPTDIDLGVLIDEHVRMLRRLIGEEVEMEVARPDDPLLVRCDRSQIEQILFNLALNARDAMPDGGRLRIATRPVTIDETTRCQHPDARPGPYVQLVVQDSGVGMDAATLDRIFEPFFTTKPIGAGTGLGLATVYGVVRQHGGFVHVSSTPGQGSTFEIHLPRCAPGPTARDEPAPRPVSGDATILLVEDDPLSLRLTRRLLEMLGYHVLVAARGDEALAQVEGGAQFDLLFTDVRLPGLDGPELYRRAARLRPGLPVLFTSGYTAELLQGLPGERAPAFLQKPFSHEELATRIAAALGVQPAR